MNHEELAELIRIYNETGHIDTQLMDPLMGMVSQIVSENQSLKAALQSEFDNYLQKSACDQPYEYDDEYIDEYLDYSDSQGFNS